MNQTYDYKISVPFRSLRLSKELSSNIGAFMFLVSFQYTAHQAVHSARNCPRISGFLTCFAVSSHALLTLPVPAPVYFYHSGILPPLGTYWWRYRPISAHCMRKAAYELRNRDTQRHWRNVHAWKFVAIYALTTHVRHAKCTISRFTSLSRPARERFSLVISPILSLSSHLMTMYGAALGTAQEIKYYD